MRCYLVTLTGENEENHEELVRISNVWHRFKPVKSRIQARRIIGWANLLGPVGGVDPRKFYGYTARNIYPMAIAINTTNKADVGIYLTYLI